MNKERFAACMTRCAEMYNQPVSAGLMDTWWQLIGERYPIEAIEAAFKRHMLDADQGRFFPKPADIVRHLEGKRGERATGAWVKVVRSIERIGPYLTVTFDDPLIMSVIEDMGGWEKFCMVNYDDLPFREQEFNRRYAEKLVNPPQSFPGRLPGIEAVADQNKKLGYQGDHAMIGNTERAQKVLEKGSEKARHQITLLKDILKGVKQIEKKLGEETKRLSNGSR